MRRYLTVLFSISLLLLCSSCGTPDKGGSEDAAASGGLGASDTAGVERFVFVGKEGRRPGIFSYDLKTRAYESVWKKKNRSVIDLAWQSGGQTVYFLAAWKVGWEGSFPFVRAAELYAMDPVSYEVKLLQELEHGLQVSSGWSAPDTFRVIMNSIDLTIASYIERKTFIYDDNGKLIRSEKKVFDLIKDGYPQFPALRRSTGSPDGTYLVNEEAGDSLSSIYLADSYSGDAVTLLETNRRLKAAGWTENESYLVFSTIDRVDSLTDTEHLTGGLYVYSMRDKKMLRQWEGEGLMNFRLYDSLLVFDKGLQSAASIQLYDIGSDEVMGKVEMNGGCGLTSIPRTARYPQSVIYSRP